jgi:hypothetical protein
MASSKRWSFTVNNPGEYRPNWDPTAMDFLVFQIERGESGTPHIQGYVRFRNCKKLDAAKNAIVCREAHMDISRGDEASNIAYCTKAEGRIAGPWTFGTAKPEAGRKGARNDLTQVAEAAKTMTLRQLAVEYPAQVLKYSTHIQKFQELIKAPVPVQRPVFVHVLWGATGVGKSHRIRMNYPPADLYVISGHGRDPWGQYEGERTVAFEEFDWSQWPIDDMKRLLDKWQVRLDARYTDKLARYTVVFITANTNPAGWYCMNGEPDRQAFFRRISRTTEILGQEQEVEMEPPAAPAAPAAPASTPVLVYDGAGVSTAPAATLARTVSVNLRDCFDFTDDPDS